MRNIWAYISAAVLLVACGGGAPFVRAATVTVNLTYTYSTTSTVNSSGAWPACNSTVTTTCISGFKIYQTDVTPFVVIGTMNNASTPSGSQTFSQSFTDSTLTYGQHQVEATTAYVDASGKAQESAYSAPASFTYNAVAPIAPGVISVTAK